ncbi:MAG: glycosyltransferase family 4 protein [Candidatus Tritonobacter lacicola]|nr:glycosyltransferase family 4 protein [Candidatus Tritonobacter lacicola]
MKISVLCPDLSDNCLGRAYLLAKILQRRYDVEIVGPIIYGRGIWWPLSHDASIRYKCVELGGVVSAYRGFHKLVRMIEGDVMYASKPLLTSFGARLLGRRGDNRPLVLDIDDWEKGSIREHYRSLSFIAKSRYLCGSILQPYRRGSFLNIMFHERLISRADKITVSNRFLQRKFGGELVWHARDTGAFCPARFDGGAVREKLGIDKERKVVMFFGTPRPPKGVEDAMKAVHMINDNKVVLIVVGMGTSKYCRGLMTIGKNMLAERFQCFGLQPFHKLPEFMSMADIVIIPQKKNLATVGQLPAKVFDAMAMAKPIVTTEVSDLPEILEGCGWIVEPGSPAQLAAAMQYVLENPREAEEKGQLARQKCVEKYSWDAMEKVLVKIFSKYE